MHASPPAPPSIAQIRVEIGDQPRLCVRPGSYELIASPADGVTTIFPLRFSKAMLTAVAVYIATLPTVPNAAPPTYRPILSNDAEYGWVATVDANGSPIVEFLIAPAAGLLIGVRYFVTAFTDGEITTYVGDNLRSSTDLTLKAVHYTIIPAILANREAMMVYRIGDRTDDPSQFIRAQLDIRKQIGADLDSEPGEGPSGASGSYYDGGHYTL